MNFFDKPALILAHRGDSFYFPENTLPAFSGAAELHVDVIETDVHLTSDRHVIIFHDEELTRVTGKKGTVCSLTLKELMEYDPAYHFTMDKGKTFPFRGQGVHFAEFEDVLKQFPEMRFNVDLKDDNTDLADEFIALLRKYNAETRVCIASFHPKMVLYVRAKAPDLLTSFTSDEFIRFLIEFKTGRKKFDKYPAPVLQGPYRKGPLIIGTRKFIRYAHSKGLKVQLWTINNPGTMRKLIANNVDGIFTDNPRLLIKISDRHKSG